LYPTMSNREAALSLMDIFGAPYAHYHSYGEVEGWFRAEGFTEVWGTNDGRRGFDVAGRLAPAREEKTSGTVMPEQLTPLVSKDQKRKG